MPIFCIDVNIAFHEKLVPITDRISTSIDPTGKEIVLKLEDCSENGPFWEREVGILDL